MKDETKATRALATPARYREAVAGRSAIAHLVDSLVPLAYPSGLPSMSWLARPFHSR